MSALATFSVSSSLGWKRAGWYTKSRASGCATPVNGSSRRLEAKAARPHQQSLPLCLTTTAWNHLKQAERHIDAWEDVDTSSEPYVSGIWSGTDAIIPSQFQETIQRKPSTFRDRSINSPISHNRWACRKSTSTGGYQRQSRPSKKREPSLRNAVILMARQRRDDESLCAVRHSGHQAVRSAPQNFW